MLKWSARIALIVAGLFCVFFLWLMFMKHNIKFYGHEAFANTEQHLSIEATEGLAGRYGIMQIWRDGNAARVMLKSKQWDRAIGLWQSARTTQSQNWRVIGTVTQPNGSDSANLTVGAGNGVRFTIAAGHGCASFDLTPSDFDRFERSSHNIQRYVDGEDAALPAASMSWGDAFHSTLVTISSLAGWPEQVPWDCGAAPNTR